MRLTDLDPRWWADAGRQGQGLTFLCPCCRQVRLGVAFTNPTDGGPPHAVTVEDQLRFVHGAEFTDSPGDVPIMDVAPGKACWTRFGETFDVLTLSPSVDASRSGHWHGFITGGHIR
jgi:uncharacterized protein DUF6527